MLQDNTSVLCGSYVTFALIQKLHIKFYSGKFLNLIFLFENGLIWRGLEKKKNLRPVKYDISDGHNY